MRSEDSRKLNTSFIERLRPGSSGLSPSAFDWKARVFGGSQFLDYPIPQLDAGIQGCPPSLFSLRPLRWILAAQLGEQPKGHGAVAVPVQAYVSFQVVLEEIEPTRKLSLQFRHQCSEHVRDHFFPPKGEGRCDGVRST